MAENIKNGEVAKNREQYGMAAKYYQEALNALAKLPDKEFIQKEEIGDLRGIQVEMLQLENTRGLSSTLIAKAQESANSSQFAAAQQQLSQAYETDRENPKLAQSILSVANTAFNQQDLEATQSILGVGLKLSHVPNEFAMNWRAVQVILLAQRALKEGQYKLSGQYIRQAMAENPHSEQVSSSIHSLLEDIERIARQTKDMGLLELMPDLFENINEHTRAIEIRDYTNKVRSSEDDGLRKSVDRQIAYATSLLYVEKPEHLLTIGERSDLLKLQQYLANRKNRLGEAQQFISDAEQMNTYLKDRSEQITDLKTRIEQEIQHIDEYTANNKQALEDEYSKLLGILQVDWIHILQLKTLLEQGNLQVSTSLQRAVAAELGEALRLIIPKARILLVHYDPYDTHVQEMLDTATRLLNGLGIQEWRMLAEEVQKQIVKLEQKFHAAQHVFEQGNLDQAIAELDLWSHIYSQDTNWLSLKARVGNVLLLKTWQSQNQADLESNKPSLALLSDLQVFAEKRIPKIYWQKSSAQSYLDHLEVWIRQEANQLMKVTSKRELGVNKIADFFEKLIHQSWKVSTQAGAPKEFISLLGNWLKLEHIVRQIDEN